MTSRASSSGRRLATVLFTDIVGSTELAASIGDRHWRELLAAYRAMVRRALRSTHGREIDDAGDGFFAVFDHPADAIACACLLTEEVRTQGLEVRSGIHMGEVETTGAKLGGIAVHIGARVCSQAGAGQVLVSSTIHDVVRGSDYGFVDLGARPLKGVPGEVQLFSVTWEDGRHVLVGGGNRRRYVIAGAAIVAVVIVVALVVLLTHRPTHGGTGAPVASIVTVAAGGLTDPVAVALDPTSDRVYAIEGNRVVRVNANGGVTTIAGTGVAGSSGDGGLATSAELDGPKSLAIDTLGDVFIADSLNNRIREVVPDGIITAFAGSGERGYSGDGTPAVDARFDDPTGVAIAPGGVVVIADSGNNVVRDATPTPTFNATTGTYPIVYIMATIAGSGDVGYVVGGPALSGELDHPQCLAADSLGNVFVADALNFRVEKITAGGDFGRTISTIAGTNAPGFSGDGGPAIDAELGFATGDNSGGGCLTVDSQGDLFIADTLNNRVREVSVSGNITTVAGNGREGFAGDDGPAMDARLTMPLGVAVDSTGRLYIADSGANRIRRVG
jgi:class 3 adenylate cyclase